MGNLPRFPQTSDRNRRAALERHKSRLTILPVLCPFQKTFIGTKQRRSSLAAPQFPLSLFPLRDKGVHTTEFAALAFLLAHACLRTFDRPTRFRVALAGGFLAVLWGFLDEVHQAFVPGRSADVLDLVADSIGASLGLSARWALTQVDFLRVRRAEGRS